MENNFTNKDEFKEDFRQIGLLIALYRRRKGWSQEQLSEKLGYSNVSFIGNYRISWRT